MFSTEENGLGQQVSSARWAQCTHSALRKAVDSVYYRGTRRVKSGIPVLSLAVWLHDTHIRLDQKSSIFSQKPTGSFYLIIRTPDGLTYSGKNNMFPQ